MRIENTLKEVFDPDSAGSPADSQMVVRKVHELGLEPFEQQDPLPPIEKEQVKLVCWMAVEAGGETPATG